MSPGLTASSRTGERGAPFAGQSSSSSCSAPPFRPLRSHKPIRLSTGPFSKYTHWKQTVFYLEDVLAAEIDDTLTVRGSAVARSGVRTVFIGPTVAAVQGVIKCRPNARNKRDLDIEVSYAFEGKHPASRVQPYRLR